MKLRIPLCVSICVASLLLSGCYPILSAVCFLSRCKPTPLLDPRTGELVHDKYLEAGQETLEYFQMDFWVNTLSNMRLSMTIIPRQNAVT